MPLAPAVGAATIRPMQEFTSFAAMVVATKILKSKPNYKMATIKGGEFLIKEIKSQDVFVSEEFNEEQKMMKEAVIEFTDREVWPHKERFENKKELTFDHLIYTSKLSFSKLSATLLNLEFSGLIKSFPGKCYQIQF